MIKVFTHLVFITVAAYDIPLNFGEPSSPAPPPAEYFVQNKFPRQNYPSSNYPHFKMPENQYNKNSALYSNPEKIDNRHPTARKIDGNCWSYFANSSGRERFCWNNANCYDFREPDEWCYLPEGARYRLEKFFRKNQSSDKQLKNITM